MSSKKKQAELREEKDWESIDRAVVKSENFIERYSKQITVIIALGVIAACAYMAYNHFYINPKSEEAQKAIAKGQYYFDNGLDSLAVYGDDNGYIGFKRIIDEFGSTKTGNLAKAYAGISLARMENYSEALDQLQSYNNSGDKLFSFLVEGAIGDCLASEGKTNEAVKHLIKAAKAVDNAVESPVLYKKAALLYREDKEYEKVIEIFTLVKNNYMNSPIAAEADKYIKEAEILKVK